MGSAVQSSPLTSTLTMRAFLTVFLAVAVSARRIPTPSDRCWLAALLVVLSLASLTLLSTPLVGYGYSRPVFYGKREAEAEPEPEPYTIGQVLTGQTNGGAITHVDYGHGLPKVAGFPYTAVHAVAPVVHHGVYSVYGKRE